jgi:hypothetical protein
MSAAGVSLEVRLKREVLTSRAARRNAGFDSTFPFGMELPFVCRCSRSVPTAPASPALSSAWRLYVVALTHLKLAGLQKNALGAM